MVKKKNTRSAFNRQRNAAKKAHSEKKWAVALRNYSKALDHDGVSLEWQLELTKGRADIYRRMGNLDGLAADLERLTEIQQAQIGEKNQDLKQGQAELEILSSIAEALVDQADLDQIGIIVGERIQQFFNAEITGIGFYDEKSSMVSVPYYYEKGKIKDVPAFRFGEGVTSHVLKTRKPIYIPTNEAGKKYGAIYSDDLPSETSLYAPIISGKKALGVISIQHSQANAYSEHELDLLMAIANSTAVALENARLFSETQQRNAELAVINSVQEALAEELEISSIYEIVGEKIREIFEADAIQINVYDLEADSNSYVYTFEDGKRLEIISVPINAMHKHFLAKGDQLYNSGLDEIYKKFGVEAPQGGRLPVSNVSAGFELRDKKILSVVISDMDHEYAFTQEDASLLQTIANSMAVAIENAQLFDESQKRLAELEIVNTAQDALASKLDIKAIYREVGEKLREIFAAQTIGIWSYDFDNSLVITEYGYEKEDEPNLPQRALTSAHREFIASGKTLLISDGMDEYLARHKHEIIEGEAPKSMLNVHLKVGNDLRGAITLQDMDHEQAFSASDVQLLETLAKSTSIALENARLFDESERRNAELAIVNTAQDALAAKLDTEAIFEEVGDKIREIFKAQTVVLYTYDLEKDLTVYEYTFEDGERFAPETVPINMAHREFIEGGKTLLMNEGLDEFLKRTKAEITTGRPPKSILSVLLKVSGEVRGAISLQDVDHEHAFNQSDVQLLETLAKSTSIALENARLFDEINESLERQTANSDILSEIANSPTEIQPVLDAVAENAARLCEADDSQIYTIEGKELREVAHFGNLKNLKADDSLPLVKGLVTGRAVLEHRTIHVEDYAKLPKSKFPISVELQKKLGHRTTLVAPLLLEGKAIGAVVVRRKKQEAFSDKQIGILENFAKQAVIAIDKARLFTETNRLLEESTQRNAELAVINSIQMALVSQLDMEGIYDAVGDKIQELFDAQIVIIGTFDLANQTQTPWYMIEKGERFYPGTVPISGMMKHFLAKRKTLIINDNTAEFLKDHGATVSVGEPIKSAVWVPLKKGNKIFGVLSLQNVDRENAFADSDVRLLETLANTMSLALENAELYDETTKRNAELAVINSLQDALAKELDIKGIYNAVGDQIKEIFDAQTVMIGSFDHKNEQVSLPYFNEAGEKFEVSGQPQSAMNRRMIRDKKPLIVNENLVGQAEKYGMVIPAGGEAKSGVWIPIIVGKEASGFVSLQNLDRENAFPESDVRLLTTVTNSLAIALENARLFDEIVQRNAELDIINSVGEAMAQQLDVATVTKIVGDKVKDLFAAEAVFIGLFDEEDDSITFPYLFDEGKYFEVEEQPRGGLSQLVKETRKPQVFNTVEEQEKAGGIVIDINSDDNVQTQSWMGVPIITADNVIGLVSVQSYQIAAFNQGDVQLLSTLATNMGVAIRNAQLYQEVQRRASEMAVLAEVGEEISQELELNALLEQIATQAMELLNGRNAIIRLAQEDGNLPTVVAVGALQDVFKGNVISIEDGITGHVVRSGIAEMVNNPLDDKRISHVPGTDEDDEAIIFAPLNAGEKTIGVLVIWREKSKHGEFSETDLNFGVGLARQAAIAITNAQLFNEATQRAEEMAALAEVGEEISQELDVVTLLQQIASRALKLLNGSDAVIRLVEEDGSMPAIVDVGERAKKMTEETAAQTVNEGINGFVARSGKAEIINSISKDSRAVPVAGLTLEELGHAMFVPLRSKDEVIGVMTIFRSGQDQEPFNEDDLKFVVSLARQAAIAMGNANLFEEVQNQKEYFEALLVNNPAAVLTVDIEERTVTSWNPAAEALFGYSEKEAIGKYVDDLVANRPDLKVEAESYSTEALESGKVKVKTKRTRKDGSLIDVEVQGLPVNVDGEQKGFIVIYHDISELEAARLAAEEANQAKSAFLANMSHELRTPLNAIIGFTRIVKRKGAEILPEKQSGNLDKVLVSAEHLLGLINTILDIAKIEAGRMDVHLTSFNIRSLIDLCVTTTQSLIDRERVKLISVVPEELPMINSDQDKIKQILLNLLSNAAKFTSEGEIKVEVHENDGQMIIEVIDSGIGISAEGLEKIFEEFSQVDESTTREYGGTGLGLSISRSLAQLMGGDITVSSQEGKGSSFTLSFPTQYRSSASSNSDGEAPEPESAKAVIDKSKPIVLAIDDNPDVVSILKENLEDAGYQVVGALGGHEGVQKARELLPHAITLDIMMPNKDGWQVLYELKHDARTKDIPVIILSIVDKKALGFRLGASDYLVKPLNEKAVLESLKGLVKARSGDESKKVLIVDDDPAVVDMVSQLLDGEGFSIEEADNGISALEKLEKFSPDVILLDLLMPKMDGFEFLEKFHKIEKHQGIPIIILTAKSLSNAEMKKLDEHVSEIIQKQGLESKTLITEIRKTIGKGIL